MEDSSEQCRAQTSEQGFRERHGFDLLDSSSLVLMVLLIGTKQGDSYSSHIELWISASMPLALSALSPGIECYRIGS